MTRSVALLEYVVHDMECTILISCILYNLMHCMSCCCLTGAMLTDDVDVAVCTIERANVILTQLLDQGEEDRLLMVVVDELHLISDSRRGFLLEVLLSKVRVIEPHLLCVTTHWMFLCQYICNNSNSIRFIRKFNARCLDS